MKTLILITALMLLSINLYSSPQDSCLKMICNNDIHWDTETGSYQGASNPDSVMIDTCTGSTTYKKRFAKKEFIIQFPENYYPFDSIMKPYTIHRVSDISSSKPDFKIQLQQLESQYGTIYFQGQLYEEVDSNFYGNPGCRMFFANYQDPEEIIAVFKANIDSLKEIVYTFRYGFPMSIKNNNHIENIPIISPNPVKDFIELKAFNNTTHEKIYIYNLYGQIIFSSEFKELINVTNLPKGLYFLKIGNKSYKFIKE
jgi:hypothetical protein